MDKLIITVTVDSTMSYPGNTLCPPTEKVDEVAAEYIRAVQAGASITHIHGVHKLESEIQPDGRRLSKTNFEGWKSMQGKIKAGSDALIQFGIASARFDEKVRLMDLKPDMMSISFNAHDEFFQPDPAYPANEMYASHPRDELEGYCKAALSKGVKVEVESFHTGAFWNMQFIARKASFPNRSGQPSFWDGRGDAGHLRPRRRSSTSLIISRNTPRSTGMSASWTPRLNGRF